MIPTDEIISMARECGLVLYFDVNVDRKEEINPITAFAALVSTRAAAIEREVCAKVCDAKKKVFLDSKESGDSDTGTHIFLIGCAGILAKEIRARGDQHEQ